MKSLLIIPMLAVSVAILPPHETTDTVSEKMRLRRQTRELEATQRRSAWESKRFDGSTNIVAKLTSMLSPLNAKGQIIEQHILTYYADGKMRYATNFFDRAKP
jgi:hypothetical protein